MKITESQLRRIIKEEITKLSESHDDDGLDYLRRDVDSHLSNNAVRSKRVTRTNIHCRTCGNSTLGWTDGRTDESGWGNISNIDGPNKICPECLDNPDSLYDLQDKYPEAKI